MLRPAFTVLALLVGASGAHAVTTLTATLTNSQEVPVVPGVTVPLLTSTGAPRPASFGTATFVINDAMTSMSFQATVNNIDLNGLQTADVNDNLTAGHIHAPAPPGATAGVVWGFFGTPFNDNNPNDVMITPFLSGVGGTISGKWDLNEGNNTTFAAQLSNILNGLSYINLHTTQFAGGEIRGQIPAIPEPETYALMLAGLGATFLARRRKSGR
jgi:hypothetical protein